jgi:hypothetical protein
MTKEIVNDIDRWAHQRLEQWYNDVVMRFEIAEIHPREGYTLLTSLLMNIAAKSLVATIRDEVSAEEIGAVFAALVTKARKQQCKQKEGQRP